MAQSEVDIANRALIRLGLDPISGTETTFSALIAAGDKKKSLEILNLHFDDWYRELLRSHPWNFAIKRKTLINPISYSPKIHNIRRFYAGSLNDDSRWDGTEDTTGGKLNNPVVLDLRSKEFTEGSEGEPPTDFSYFDHGLQDLDVIYLENSRYSILNNRWFYVKRGYNDDETNADGVRASGSIQKESGFVSLYSKLGDASSIAWMSEGQLPTDARGDTYGYSVDGENIDYLEADDYYYGATVKTIKKNEWDYGYAVPEDVIRLLNVNDLVNGEDFVLERRNSLESNNIPHREILCNVGSTINVKYVGFVDINTWDKYIDPLWVDCLTIHIALKLSEMFIKTSSITNSLNEEFILALSKAKSIDAQEGSPVEDFHSSWADEMGRST